MISFMISVVPPKPCRIADTTLEQRLAISSGNTPVPARRAGGRTGLERGLDDGDDELHGLRVYDNVPAEQYAADDLPGVPDSVLRVGGYERHLSMMVGSTVTGG